ncbi:hypothetical protein OKW50_007839 [Paraburkholderia youngii]|uniref:IS3 family transposase n=1 Tax=Paraburkholderia youngii TaxID=2782701 RepID=UPI003D22CEFE
MAASPATRAAQAAELARSTFYYQSKVLDGGERHEELKAKIKAVYERHKDRYGYRRIAESIRLADQRVTPKTVRRLMV